jgi:hypothetical protein
MELFEFVKKYILKVIQLLSKLNKASSIILLLTNVRHKYTKVLELAQYIFFQLNPNNPTFIDNFIFEEQHII